jgi:predicted nucleic acid binding AN1-type Zn finger protein
MNVEDKTQYIMAIRNFVFTKKKEHKEYTDITASDVSNQKILLRSAIESQGKARNIGVDEAKDMVKVMQIQGYDSGIFISSGFTEAAIQEMAQNKIQLVSDEYMPHFGKEKIYLTITNYLNKQCNANCGKIPRQKSECKGQFKGKPCKVKALRDNAAFHFAQGWVDLMQNDLKQLLSLNEAAQ